MRELHGQYGGRTPADSYAAAAAASESEQSERGKRAARRARTIKGTREIWRQLRGVAALAR